MIAFRSPEQAIGAAIAIQHALSERPHQARRATLIALRIGIHRGPSVFCDGDYFGRTVAMAAQAAADEVFVSADTLVGIAARVRGVGGQRQQVVVDDRVEHVAAGGWDERAQCGTPPPLQQVLGSSVP